MLDLDTAQTMVRELSETVPPSTDADVEDLPVGTQQRVEIVKARSRARSTCSSSTSRPRCSPAGETDSCSGSCIDLANGGTSIVFITHKLREVLAVADRLYVLRHGAVVGEVTDITNTTTTDLATMMVGPVVLNVEKGAATRASRPPDREPPVGTTATWAPSMARPAGAGR